MRREKIKSVTILSIESSCDDTSAAVIRDGKLMSNVIASQKIHEEYGGVVPELASRAHQQNILPVVDTALKRAGVERTELSAIAFTRGPGLLGSLLVGTSFAKGLAIALDIPLVEVNHLQGHIMAHFLEPSEEYLETTPSLKGIEIHHPNYPFLCLLVSGGNSQIVKVEAYDKMTILGQTIDDAAGEAFDKCAKVLGLPYPGGPWIDRLSKEGDAKKYPLAKPNIAGYDYSFSGLKTSFLYTIRDMMRAEGVSTVAELKEKVPNLTEDLCASLQQTIIDILLSKLKKAAKEERITEVAIAGGVSANSGLREALTDYGRRYKWKVYIPPFSFTTDNAAMIGQAGYYKYFDGDFCAIDAVPYAKTRI
ncbi:MAG: tRNA (adenosine(37)-N6)-threonylcarbamoyltransferase complex transferase subunit TsaD [Paludibacteraceae bacterium]|nr:tRNA (adenosine(37)-N6)-threonylcarbamoyltransferase complex transferase subunit TsaD [Paludibacteraceae bacterium]